MDGSTLTNVQKVNLHVAGQDAKGGPATLPNAPVWSISDPAIATLEPAADGLSCFAVAVAVGAATVTATADPGTGTPITATYGVTVTGSVATQLVITADAPVDQ